MLDKAFIHNLETHLSTLRQHDIHIIQSQSVGGGCINESYHLSLDNGDHLFIKLNDARLLDMFEAEAEGLTSLSEAECFVIPKPVITGQWKHQSYLVMEHLTFIGRYTEQDFATRLAQMHLQTNERYGFQRNNYIGASPQINTWSDNWYEFYMQERLERQLSMLSDKGRAGQLTSLWPEFGKACELLFGIHQPKPSLLHGDLWQGNVSQTSTGCSIFDPACYYGDHETDLAMLNLFGHLDDSFYQSYKRIKPIDAGFALRKTWYNLYHVLNHANLFGGSYTNQAENMVKQLIMALNR